MLRLALPTLLTSLALFCAGCDAGETRPATGQPGGPVDGGEDIDVGSGDTSATPVATNGKLRVDGTTLKNASGATVQLKGVSSMWLNWENDGFAENATALKWMRNNWKLSIIRAAMGIDPNNAYLADPARAKTQVTTVVDNAVAAGVYVIIDWHAHNAHQSEAVAFFTEMSKKYAGVPNVLYETFNEPLGIDWPELKIYHEAVVAAIRQNDAEAVIILGTPNYSQEVLKAARDRLAGTNLMYTLHFYSCSHTDSLRAQGAGALQSGLPLFVTEWGATHADGGVTGELCLEEAQRWTDWMASSKVSWAAWKLDNCTDLSCLLNNAAPVAGGWTDQYLHGHAQFVRGRMQQ